MEYLCLFFWKINSSWIKSTYILHDADVLAKYLDQRQLTHINWAQSVLLFFMYIYLFFSLSGNIHFLLFHFTIITMKFKRDIDSLYNNDWQQQCCKNLKNSQIFKRNLALPLIYLELGRAGFKIWLLFFARTKMSANFNSSMF